MFVQGWWDPSEGEMREQIGYWERMERRMTTKKKGSDREKESVKGSMRSKRGERGEMEMRLPVGSFDVRSAFVYGWQEEWRKRSGRKRTSSWECCRY